MSSRYTIHELHGYLNLRSHSRQGMTIWIADQARNGLEVWIRRSEDLGGTHRSDSFDRLRKQAVELCAHLNADNPSG